MPIAATKPAIPASVQRRLDAIERRVIQRVKTTGGLSELDTFFSNSISRRSAGAVSDSARLNHSGGKVGKQ